MFTFIDFSCCLSRCHCGALLLTFLIRIFLVFTRIFLILLSIVGTLTLAGLEGLWPTIISCCHWIMHPRYSAIHMLTLSVISYLSI